MTINVLDAIIHLLQTPVTDLQQQYVGRNRANSKCQFTRRTH
ncbi:hypothetical protein [Moraxella atlantae]|nr:hypothetical protein [Moraxella atlantae]